MRAERAACVRERASGAAAAPSQGAAAPPLDPPIESTVSNVRGPGRLRTGDLRRATPVRYQLRHRPESPGATRSGSRTAHGRVDHARPGPRGAGMTDGAGL